MASELKIKLFDSDDDGDGDQEEHKLTINKEYAEKYTAWKEKEELQKLKEKYGDLSSSSSSSDEDEVVWSRENDREWLRVITALHVKDPKIYDENFRFNCDVEESGSSESEESEKSSKKKKKKDDGPVTLRDFERRLITEKKGVFSESKDETETRDLIYHDQQEARMKSLGKFVADTDSSDEEENILSERKESEKEKEEEKDEYLQFLRGEKQLEDLKRDKELCKELVPLRDYFTRPEATEAEKFMWKHVYCQGSFTKKSEQEQMNANMGEDLSEDEEEINDQEEFEQAYNFRHEEPDKNFIKQYKRNPEESMRQRVNKRVQKRKEVQERKRMALEEKREEIRRLKKLKRKELESRMERLMKECPSRVDFEPEDLKGEFDPKAYDKMMKEKFENTDDEDDGDDDKPDMGDMEDIMSIGSYEDIFDEERSVADGSQHTEAASTSGMGAEGASTSKFNMYAGLDPSWTSGYDPSQSSRSRRRQKKSKFKQALAAEKPLFSEVYEKYKTSKTPFEDYVQKYYNLDYKEHGFRYRNVVANDYGLQGGEILWLPTNELNAWVSMKKLMEQKTDTEEEHDKRKYQSAKMQRKIIQVLPSLKKIDDEESKFEDIRPSVLCQQKMMKQQEANNDSDRSEMSESQQPAHEDLGSRLQTGSQASHKKRKRKTDLSESAEQGAPPRKKKKAKSSSQLLTNAQETEVTCQTERKQAEDRKKKKKKMNAAGDEVEASENRCYTEEKNPVTETQTEGKKKKKKKLRTEDQGGEAEQDTHRTDPPSQNTTDEGPNSEIMEKKRKKKEKQKEGKLSSENPGEEETKREGKKKSEGCELQQTPQSGKKKSKGKKKGKKSEVTHKRKGYLPLDKIQESRLTAFNIDPRKFKYTKDRIVPDQAD